MDEKFLKQLLREVKAGQLSESAAFSRLKGLPFADLGHTKVDHHRALRQGAAEVIFAPGKTPAQILAIIRELKKAGSGVLITRLSKEQARAVRKAFPRSHYNPAARTIRLGRSGKKAQASPRVLILSGGTADQPVVEEARETLLWLGLEPEVIRDVGVAGIHRLLAHQEALDRARAIIVAAGMEGALASVVAGLVDKPVIGVPVSVGYGAGGGGWAALLGMLNSCAAGVTVVNIDNGFGAAFAAMRIIRAGG